VVACLQDQLAAARAQMQQMQLSSESLQWLQSTKAKLQADLGNTNAHLQMERQRRSDATMQLQTVLAERQRMKEELDALQMQLQQQCLQNGLETHPSAARGTLGTAHSGPCASAKSCQACHGPSLLVPSHMCDHKCTSPVQRQVHATCDQTA
jgi:hypothetical protein